jgi:hypothetical protein
MLFVLLFVPLAVTLQDCTLPVECTCEFYVSVRLESNILPEQYWLIFVTEIHCALSDVDIEFWNIIWVHFRPQKVNLTIQSFYVIFIVF